MKVLKSEEMLCDHCVDRIKIGLATSPVSLSLPTHSLPAS